MAARRRAPAKLTCPMRRWRTNQHASAGWAGAHVRAPTGPPVGAGAQVPYVSGSPDGHSGVVSLGANTRARQAECRLQSDWQRKDDDLQHHHDVDAIAVVAQRNQF